MNSVAESVAARILMVKDQLRRRGITDEAVLEVLRAVPREKFVRPEDVSKAYDDEPLKIDLGQTISQPYIVALTCQSLELRQTDRVLEIGTGSGYQTAILSRLCKNVVSIERIVALLESARTKLRDLGVQTATLIQGDGTLGAPNLAPFDAIAVTAAAPRVPPSLIDQLGFGGRMVIPVGDRGAQELLLIQKNLDGRLAQSKLCDCRFVPLIGHHGFDPS